MANRIINKRTIGSALGYAFKPNLQRSFKPFSRSHANITALVVQIFLSLGLIDRTHPFARKNAHQPRLRDVLGLAWGKLNWSNPFRTQNVIVLSVTLILATGGLAILGFVGAASLGIGQAQAQMFVPPNPSTDLAMGYIAKAFGVDTAGHAAGTDLLVTAFRTMMATYSSAMLVIAGFIVLYIVLNAIVGTATDGRVGGSGFNHTWAPLRLIIAIGLLVPIGAGGYSSGQLIAVKVAEWGSGLASNVWTQLGNALATRGSSKVIASVTAPALGEAVMGTLASEVCMTLANQKFADSSVPGGRVDQVTVKERELSAATGGNYDNNITMSYSDNAGNPICGSISIPQVPKTPNADAAAATQIAAAQLAAYKNMVTALRASVITPMQAKMDRYFDSSGALVEQFAGDDFTAPINTVIRNYQNSVAAAITAAEPAAATAANNAMSVAIKNSGWAGAASWFNTISRLNAEFFDRARSTPSVSTPSLASVSAADPSALAAGAYSSAQKFSQVAAQRAIAQGENTAGSGTAPATTAGLSSESTSSSSIGAFVNSVLTKALSFASPFDAVGANATLSETNPLADLARIGNYMINAAGLVAGSAVALMAAAGAADSIKLIPFIGSVAGGIASAGSLIAPMLMVLAAAIWAPGVLLTFVLPLIPFIRFMFGVLNWIFNILECIIAIPLFALAHLSKSGDGFMTGSAQTGYMLLLSLFIRPSLMIVAFGISTAMFVVGVGILNDLWSSAVVGWRGNGATSIGPLSQIIYTVIYAGIAYAMCNSCFKLLESIPDSAMQWIGGRGFQSGDGDERVAAGAAAGVSDIAKGTVLSTAIMGPAAQNIGKGMGLAAQRGIGRFNAARNASAATPSSFTKTTGPGGTQITPNKPIDTSGLSLKDD